MRPIYPNFENISHRHKELLLRSTSNLPLYCDYDYEVLKEWSNKKHPTKISFLNNNLLVLDVDTNKTEYEISLCGNNMLDETLDVLVKEFGKVTKVPEIYANEILKFDNKYKIVEDVDNHNYVYDTKTISALQGNKFRHKRSNINKFKKNNSYQVIEIDVAKVEYQNSIILLFKKLTKYSLSNLEDLNRELDAVTYYLKNKSQKTMNIGILYKDELIAFSATSLKENGLAIGEFGKADTVNHKGSSDYLLYITASMLYNQKNYEKINLEQDTGLLGLRTFKRSWKPDEMYKLYTVYLTDE